MSRCEHTDATDAAVRLGPGNSVTCGDCGVIIGYPFSERLPLTDAEVLSLDLDQWGDTEMIEHVPERLAISVEKEDRRQRFLMQVRLEMGVPRET